VAVVKPGIRRPNRRKVPALLEATSGELCVATQKIRYVDERTARLAAAELGRRHGESLETYRCTHCSDWHFGLSRRAH
jgi:hypothetical protein